MKDTFSADARMDRIRTVIRIVRWIVSAGLIVLVVFGGWFVANLIGLVASPVGTQISFSPLLTYSAPFKVPATVLMFAFVRTIFVVIGTFILLWWLDLIEAGEFFTDCSVRYLKWLGWLVIADWVVQKLLDATARRGVEITCGQLVLGLLIVLIAWVTDEGRKIQEEQKLTV